MLCAQDSNDGVIFVLAKTKRESVPSLKFCDDKILRRRRNSWCAHKMQKIWTAPDFLHFVRDGVVFFHQKKQTRQRGWPNYQGLVLIEFHTPRGCLGVL